MSLPNPTITAFLDLPASGGDLFVLGHPVKGELGGDYGLAGDMATVLSDAGFDITIDRGRTSELDTISPGTCTLSFRNHDRRFDGMDTEGPYYGFLRPGRPIEVAIYGETIFAGKVDDWELAYSVNLDAVASVPAVDVLGQLARVEFDAWTTTDLQTASERLLSILARPEVYGDTIPRDITGGVSILQDDNVTWGSNVLNYMQLVAQSDLGVVFASRRGVLTFRDRHSLTTPTPQVTFSDNGAGVPFHGATISSAGAKWFNRVGVDRDGGTLQTVEDTDSIERDGVHSLSRTELLLASDTASAGMANFLLSLYKDPENRVSSITVNVSSLPAAWQPIVAALDIYDVIGLGWTPQRTGSQIIETMSIEGIRHSIPVGGSHLMTFALAPISQTSVFTLGDPILGELAGIGRLAF